MKVNANISVLLLFAVGADAQALSGDCKDFKISNSKQCSAYCKSLAMGNRRYWSNNEEFDGDNNLTSCECRFSTGNSPETNGLPTEGAFTCTTNIQPETPVYTKEECPSSIKTWDQCQSKCKSFSSNRSVSYKGRSANQLTNCTCNYGLGRKNTYICTRKNNVESYLRSN